MRVILNAALVVLLSGFVLTGSAQSNRSPAYVTNYVTASPSFRRVNGQLYNVERSTNWQAFMVETLHVSSNGVLGKIFSGKDEHTGGYVVGEKVLIKNHPDMNKIKVEQFLGVRAMKTGTVDDSGNRYQCWDCGTPNVVPVVTVRTNR